MKIGRVPKKNPLGIYGSFSSFSWCPNQEFLGSCWPNHWILQLSGCSRSGSCPAPWRHWLLRCPAARPRPRACVFWCCVEVIWGSETLDVWFKILNSLLFGVSHDFLGNIVVQYHIFDEQMHSHWRLSR